MPLDVEFYKSAIDNGGRKLLKLAMKEHNIYISLLDTVLGQYIKYYSVNYD